MKNRSYLIIALALALLSSLSYADGIQAMPVMGNRSVGIPAPPNPLPHQDTQKAIMQSYSQSDATIMRNQAQQRTGRRMEGSGMQNGMNSSMGAR
ncbi:MAG: hypothetical protein ACYC3O_05315 [Burkholderiales bacterium]